MAVMNPPLHMQNRTDHTAQGDRLLIRAQRRIAGVSQYGDMLVTAQAAPNMSVLVASGAAFVPGTESSLQGTYFCYNDAALTKTITASDPSLPRKDLISARVRDAFYSGADNDWDIIVTAGTPNASPSLPSAPANSVSLAEVNVLAGASTIQNANIVNLAPIARSSEQHWQHTSASDVYEWYTSAGVKVAELDNTGHLKAFGTTGGVTKVRKPLCMVRVVALSVPNAAVTKVAFSAAMVDIDTDGMFDDANDWIEIKTAGWYTVRASITFNASGSAGYRAVGIVRNNTTEIIRHAEDPNSNAFSTTDHRSVETSLVCNPGDTFFMRVWQNSGAAVAINNSAAEWGSTFLRVEWDAPLT